MGFLSEKNGDSMGFLIIFQSNKNILTSIRTTDLIFMRRRQPFFQMEEE